jgi:hypothetical protein
MARIVVQAVYSDGEPRRWTLSERIVTENLDSDHYVTHLIERLRWATADAQAEESQSAELASGTPRPRPTITEPDTGVLVSSRPAAAEDRVRA